jgi:small subunit ribosomal protein S2
MQRPPDAMFVVDLKTEVIAVREAQRLRIPIIGLVDTNCDPDGIDFVVPGNDDAIRSCTVIARAIGDVVAEGQSVFRAEEDRARQEAEERARLEAEERQRREAEERARREAEQRAIREAQQAVATGQAPPAEPIQPAVAEPAPTGGERAAQESSASHDRAAQEAVEAEAVAEAGRPQPDPEAAVRQSAESEIAPANSDNVTGTSPDPAPPATDHTPDPATPIETEERSA